MKPPGKPATWLLCGLFLCIFGAKLLIIANHGAATPFWDQWDAEADHLYRPWTEGDLHPLRLFAAHNEHRILWTRLLGLLELGLNGGIWDPLFQMVVNAGLHGLAILLLLVFLRREIPRHLFPSLVLFSLLFLLPFGWENTLSGFQSQFYFLLLFGVLSLRGLIASAPLTAGWWLGFAAFVAAGFSVASGILVGVAAAAGSGLRLAWERRTDRRAALGIVLLLGYAALVGFATPTLDPPPPKADSAGDFAISLARALAFPFCAKPLMASWIQLPLLVLAGSWILPKRKRPEGQPPWFLAGTAIWLGLNAAATAYGRGAAGAGPASRYMDALAFGLPLNFAALLLLVSVARGHGLRRAAAGWTAILAIGALGVFGTRTLHWIRNHALSRRMQHASVAQFLADSDRNRLAAQPPAALPYPAAGRLADLLENATVRDLLPPPLRGSLRAVRTDSAGFVAGGVPPSIPPMEHGPVWGSHGPFGSADTGRIAREYARPSKGGFLEIPVAGFSRPGHLQLYAETLDGRRLADLASGGGLKPGWRSLHIRRPREAFRIVAVDADPEGWIAFADPKETGLGTRLARAALRAWFVFLGAGAALLLWAFVPAAAPEAAARP